MSADPVLGLGAYAAGVIWLVIVGASITVTCRAVAIHIAPADHSTRTVAGAVAALGQLTVTGQLLGALGQLRAVPFVLAMTIEAAVIWAVIPSVRHRVRLHHNGRSATGAGHVRDLAPRVAAVAAAGLVGLQWATHTLDALGRGMTHADTLWYHGPFSARFLQLGSLGDLGTLGYSQARYFPLGSELLHTEVALPFHRDLLSPLLNLGFFALAVAAAVALGARWRATDATVLAVVAVLGTPTMAGTQPGQASNDVVAVALLLSAVALAVHSEHRAGWVALAGVALGLAAGTKVTVVVVGGVLAAGGLIVLLRAGHRRAALWWLAGMALPVIAWPIRNLVVAGTPLPFVDIRIGPIQWEALTDRGGPSLLDDLRGGEDGWGLRDGVRRGFGVLWPVVLLPVAGCVLAWRRGPRDLRPAAAAAILGTLGFALLPNTGGSSFQFNLRYLTPPLIIGAAVCAVWASQHRAVRPILVTLLTTVVALNLVADHHERVAAWPIHPAIALAGALAGLTGVALLRSIQGAGRPIAGLALALGLLASGWYGQQHTLERRYVDAELEDDALNARFRAVSGARVEVLGTPESYPFFGADLSNRVGDHTDELTLATFVPKDPCRHWREELRGTDWIVISDFGYLQERFGPDERHSIFGSDPAVTTIVDHENVGVYRVTGDLDPSACAPLGGA